MTALPRGRSREVGMGGGGMMRKSTLEGPKLNRANSSSMMPAASTGSFRSDSGGSGRLRRPGSASDRGSAVIDKNVNMTITDLFLSDVITQDSETIDIHDMKPFVPLPLSVKSRVDHLRKSESKQIDLIKQQRQRAKSETKLQEYWKSNAQWPPWPQLKDCRERLNKFKEAFLEGVDAPNLIRHCGEHLKCSAYVVICVEKIGIRSAPTADGDKQTGDALHPGQMVLVDNILTFDGVNYLKLRSGGWVFERKGITKCMSYTTEVEIGLWWYQVVSAEFAEIRRSPNFREAARTGHMLVPGEVIVVALRCNVDGYRWMALADGRGWMFEMRPPINGLEEAADERVIAECDEHRGDTEEPSMNMQTGGIVELGMWEYEVMKDVLAVGSSTSGWLLPRGEQIFVDMRVPSNGLKVKEASSRASVSMETRIWLRLHDGRGWLPKTHLDGLPNVRFVRVPTVGSQHNAKHQNPTKPEDCDWMSGVA